MSLRFGSCVVSIGLCLLLSTAISAQEKKDPSIDGKSVGEWIAQLKSKDGKDLQAAKRALVKLGAPGVPALVEALEASKDHAFRLQAFEVIERLRSRAHDAVPALIKIMKSNETDDRVHAAYLLGGIGPAAKAAAPDMLEGLKSKDASWRRACAVSLGEIGADPDKVVGPIANALKDEDARVRQSAADGLYHIGPPAKPAIPALLIVLKDDDFAVRRAAQTALRRIDPKRPVDEIAPLNQPPAKRASIAPPKFAKFVGYDKAKDVVNLIEIRQVEVPRFFGEKIVKENGKEKKVPDIRYDSVTEEVLRPLPANELKFFDGEGKPLEKQAALDRMAQSGMALLSADGEMVNGIYMPLLNRSNVVVIQNTRTP